jgi:hypothetical protein
LYSISLDFTYILRSGIGFSVDTYSGYINRLVMVDNESGIAVGYNSKFWDGIYTQGGASAQFCYMPIYNPRIYFYLGIGPAYSYIRWDLNYGTDSSMQTFLGAATKVNLGISVSRSMFISISMKYGFTFLGWDNESGERLTDFYKMDFVPAVSVGWKL